MKSSFYTILFILGLVSCQDQKIDESATNQNAVRAISTHYDTLIYLNDVKVRIVGSKSFEYDLLLLPGWNFPIDHWQDSTNLLQIADSIGINLVMPEMGKSIYHKQTYLQTRADWKKEPTLIWLSDTLLPLLNSQFELFLKNRKNGVLGISTGGRGAIAISAKLPEVFTYSVSLSGDFSTLEFPTDNLYNGYFGPLNTNLETWKQEDLVRPKLDKRTTIYLIHGQSDNIVPYRHSSMLYQNLRAQGNKVHFHLLKNEGHNYSFWKHQIDSLFLKEIYQ